ncbi:7-cyano-7-deazaguanine synthase QueC [Salibacterium salarium]|uniref:7-cyano-7-deazaguanine synthase n=1 Tax=Salibacterium salarium TaxID=284579 RepID=A0A3R9QMV2_9BACI|nr:7-cyano-7-deazaguanine synthase QueC [Salibacterium salarium]RSL29371.1 7-cyano-7-deazaguanine synthase QueC [Salibacterium salarium]
MSLADEKAVVVFSGGQDSTTCLFWALERFKEVSAVTFDYGQRHDKEIKVAEDIAQELGVEHKVLDMSLLNQLAPNALTRDDMEVKAGENGEMPTTFVEGRNLLFFSFASIYASQWGAKHVVTGVCETDYSGYPDCRDVFVKSLNVSLNLGIGKEFVLHTPLMWLDKKETWELADNLGRLSYVKNKTLTCYHGILGDGCGECPACQLRQAGYDQYRKEKEREAL